MNKIYKIIAIVSILMNIGLMTWNIILLSENKKLKDMFNNYYFNTMIDKGYDIRL